MPTVWLRHRDLQKRYSCSRPTVDRVVDERGLPPKLFPLAGRAPMWPLELLDFWDSTSVAERELILGAWPDWRGALTQIERDRVAASAPQPRRKRGKQAKQRKQAASASVSASA
jgi:hypothetical protein